VNLRELLDQGVDCPGIVLFRHIVADQAHDGSAKQLSNLLRVIVTDETVALVTDEEWVRI